MFPNGPVIGIVYEIRKKSRLEKVLYTEKKVWFPRYGIKQANGTSP